MLLYTPVYKDSERFGTIWIEGRWQQLGDSPWERWNAGVYHSGGILKQGVA
ncbi:MAG: hypothetical protein ACK50P_02235 [Planctomycetaceae bacterium]|jgi:hypothetical protein